MSGFQLKNSPVKVAGIIFLIIALAVAVIFTNNTVRKFVFNSFADGGRVKNCAGIGNAAKRNLCEEQEKDINDKKRKQSLIFDSFASWVDLDKKHLDK